jgi:DNA-binding transcriptional MerR regulator
MSLAEVAKFCGRSPQTLRKYYSEGVLAEPASATKYAGDRTLRRFTLQEAERLKADFDSAPYGTFAKRKKNAAQSRG